MASASAPRRAPVRGNVRAGVDMPVGRIQRQIREDIGCGAELTSGAYLAGVLQFAADTIISEAAASATADKRKRITQQDLQRAITGSDELRDVFKNTAFPGGGAEAFDIGAFTADCQMRADASKKRRRVVSAAPAAPAAAPDVASAAPAKPAKAASKPKPAAKAASKPAAESAAKPKAKAASKPRAASKPKAATAADANEAGGDE